jgi:hypothetical protein
VGTPELRPLAVVALRGRSQRSPGEGAGGAATGGAPAHHGCVLSGRAELRQGSCPHPGRQQRQRARAGRRRPHCHRLAVGTHRAYVPQGADPRGAGGGQRTAQGPAGPVVLGRRRLLRALRPAVPRGRSPGPRRAGGGATERDPGPGVARRRFRGNAPGGGAKRRGAGGSGPAGAVRRGTQRPGGCSLPGHPSRRGTRARQGRHRGPVSPGERSQRSTRDGAAVELRCRRHRRHP